MCVSVEMAREITFSRCPSSGITLLYLLFKPTAFRGTQRRSGLWASRAKPLRSLRFSRWLRQTEVQIHWPPPLIIPAALKRNARLAYCSMKFWSLAKGSQKFSLSIFHYSAWTRLHLRDNQRQIGSSYRLVWKWSAKVSHFFIVMLKKKKKKKNKIFLINWIEDESSGTLRKNRN